MKAGVIVNRNIVKGKRKIEMAQEGTRIVLKIDILCIHMCPIQTLTFS